MIDDRIAELITAGRALQDQGLNAGTSGNLSARLDGNLVVMTRRRVRKGSLTEQDFVTVDILDPSPESLQVASSEYRVHLACYRSRPEIAAVIHAHSPALTAIGLRRSSFPPLLPELEVVTGPIRIAGFDPSGSEQLANAVGRLVAAGTGLVILKRHGAVAVGERVAEALDRLEVAENGARTILLAGR